jgi:hypothetical protein
MKNVFGHVASSNAIRFQNHIKGELKKVFKLFWVALYVWVRKKKIIFFARVKVFDFTNFVLIFTSCINQVQNIFKEELQIFSICCVHLMSVFPQRPHNKYISNKKHLPSHHFKINESWL